MEFLEATLAELMLHYTVRDGFIFYSITNPANIRDAIVLHIPHDAQCLAPQIPASGKSLEEHIAFINEHKLEKALIIADTIDFICRCPSLKYLHIIPSYTAPNGFDFSPLYQLPNLKYLSCQTIYGITENYGGYIDYSKLPTLEAVTVDASKYDLNISQIPHLRTLYLNHFGKKGQTLRDAFSSPDLDVLMLTFFKLKTLDGIDTAKAMKIVELERCRSLEDISALESVRDSLVALQISHCPKITDFSVLSKLYRLIDLRLNGKNVLPDLSFLRDLPNLQCFILKMDVANGDLSPCLEVPYVYCKNKKHFSHSNEQLPKNATGEKYAKLLYDANGIEYWRS